MSYTGDPANSVTDRIRLNVGDTDLYEEGLSDEVYNYLLDLNDNKEGLTSQSALKLLVTKYAKYADEKAGELEEKGSQKYSQYLELLDKVLKDPSYSFLSTGLPYVGGISNYERLNNPSSNPFKLSNPLTDSCY